MPVELAGALLSERTTLRLGGPARRLVVAETESQVIEAVSSADDRAEPVLVLGGGSNLIVADEGFDGLVVEVATRGIETRQQGYTAQAGEDWDAFVAGVVDEGLSGIEALAGIPGRMGATPIQNVGAYGQEVAQTITSVRVYDRRTHDIREMKPQECGFAYRTSVFKGSERYVVLQVSYQLEKADPGPVIRYPELARRLGVAVGARAPSADVRAAVLELRRGKGMVLDAADHDTWSAGSFFTNPVLAAADLDRLPPETPRWPEPDGRVKLSAAWLIEQSGFAKGYGRGLVQLSTKHTLALTNRGGASTAELLALAREIRSEVRQRFGIELVPEPALVGCSL